MLRPNHAVRLGLRAASRNPELSFAKALIDQAGSLLAFLPVILGALLLIGAAEGPLLEALAKVLRAAFVLRWPVAGAVLAALAILFLAGIVFWAGALPVLAADAELDRRPPAGNFVLLLSRGAARTLVAGALGWGLALLFSICCVLALLFAIPAGILRPSVFLFAAAAAIAVAFAFGSVLLDTLARLMLIRSAAFGDGPVAAFGKASSLLGARLGACVTVAVAFLFLELIAGSVAAALTGLVSGAAFLDVRLELTALAPRGAIGLAFAAVVAWLEVGRMAALAAIAADAEGLLPIEQPVPVADLVIDALPADDR